MPTRELKALRDNLPLINELFGHVDNAIVKDNYSEALNILNEKHKSDTDYIKWKSINDKMRGVSLSEDEGYNVNKGINYTDPEIKNTEAYKKFSEYLTNTIPSPAETTAMTEGRREQGTSQGNVSPTGQLSFEDFISRDPVMQNEINAKFMKETKTPLTEEEYRRKEFQKAGLTDEDMNFYGTYKPPFASEYNKELTDFFTEYQDKLDSSGSYGNKYQKLLAEKLGSMQRTDEQPMKKTHQFHDGYEFTYDEYGNQIGIKKLPEKEKDFKLSSDAEIKEYTDADGTVKYGIFEPDGVSNDAGYQGWKFTGVSSTQRDFERQEGIGEFEAKSKGTGRSRGRGRSGRSGKGTSDEGNSEMDKDNIKLLKEFAKMKEESVAVGWQEYSKKNNYGNAKSDKYEETLRVLQQRFPDQDIDALANDLYKQDFKSKGKFKNETEWLESKTSGPRAFNKFGQKDLNDAYNNADEDEKTAIANVNNFFNSIVKAWGRADLTPDQWRDEIEQDKNNFSDAEWNLILATFKRYTGENY